MASALSREEFRTASPAAVSSSCCGHSRGSEPLPGLHRRSGNTCRRVAAAKKKKGGKSNAETRRLPEQIFYALGFTRNPEEYRGQEARRIGAPPASIRPPHRHARRETLVRCEEEQRIDVNDSSIQS